MDQKLNATVNLNSELSSQQRHHSLERTNPKGEDFIGRCVQCGATGLSLGDMTECKNPGKVSVADSIIAAIEGPDGDL
jgi:hypothetical protein